MSLYYPVLHYSHAICSPHHILQVNPPQVDCPTTQVSGGREFEASASCYLYIEICTTIFLTYDDRRQCPGYTVAFIYDNHYVICGQYAFVLQGLIDSELPGRAAQVEGCAHEGIIDKILLYSRLSTL